VNQLRYNVEIIKIKKHIEEQEKRKRVNQIKVIFRNMITPKKYFLNVCYKIKIQFIHKYTIIKDFLRNKSRHNSITLEADNTKSDSKIKTVEPKQLFGANACAKSRWYPTSKDIEIVRKQQKEKKNLIVWDIENISYKEIDNILKKICSVGTIYCVSVYPLSKNITDKLFAYILLYGIKVVVGHEDSDEKIKELIKSNYKKFKSITIISSDTDFVPTIKRVLKRDKRVYVIAKDKQKKGMLMRLNIDHKNLSISTI